MKDPLCLSVNEGKWLYHYRYNHNPIFIRMEHPFEEQRLQRYCVFRGLPKKVDIRQGLNTNPNSNISRHHLPVVLCYKPLARYSRVKFIPIHRFFM